MTTKKLVLVLTLMIVASLNMARASITVKHICPLGQDGKVSYNVEVESSVIKKQLCHLYEIDKALLERAYNGEKISKFLSTSQKKELRFIMIAYLNAQPEEVSKHLFSLKSLDRLVASAKNYNKLAIENMGDLENMFPEYSKAHEGDILDNSKFYSAKVTYGSGLFKVKDKIVKHSKKVVSGKAESIVSNLIKSKKVYGRSFSVNKVLPYENGTILLMYSEDLLKHPSAGMVMKKIKKGAIKSANKFVGDLQSLINKENANK